MHHDSRCLFHESCYRTSQYLSLRLEFCTLPVMIVCKCALKLPSTPTPTLSTALSSFSLGTSRTCSHRSPPVDRQLPRHEDFPPLESHRTAFSPADSAQGSRAHWSLRTARSVQHARNRFLEC